jgi:hypothetical protein
MVMDRIILSYDGKNNIVVLERNETFEASVN